MKEIKIYTTPNCKYCKDAKKYFDENNISYTSIDVAADAKERNHMVEISGQMGVPVIEVGDRVIIGFDKNAFNDAFKVE